MTNFSRARNKEPLRLTWKRSAISSEFHIETYNARRDTRSPLKLHDKNINGSVAVAVPPHSACPNSRKISFYTRDSRSVQARKLTNEPGARNFYEEIFQFAQLVGHLNFTRDAAANIFVIKSPRRNFSPRENFLKLYTRPFQITLYEYYINGSLLDSMCLRSE